MYSFEWLINRKAVIISDDNIFQNALNDALDYQNTETNLQRISKIKSFSSKYNWEGIEYPAVSKDWKKVEQNNRTIALNKLFILYNTETIRVAYRSEYKHKCKNQVNLLMITDGKLSNHHGDIFCLNCFNSYTTKINLKNMKKCAIKTTDVV